MKLILVKHVFLFCIFIFSKQAFADQQAVSTEQTSIAIPAQKTPAVSFSALLQRVDFNSFVNPRELKNPHNFSETYAYVELGFRNSSSVSLLTEFDSDYNDPSNNDFWNTELRYNHQALKLADLGDVQIDSHLNAGVELPTSSYAESTLTLKGGAIAEGDVVLTNRRGSRSQAYKADVESYRHFYGEAKTFDSSLGDYNGRSNFEWEFHEKINAVFNFGQFWSKLELKHYDLIDFDSQHSSYFRHWESVGYHFTNNCALEMGHAYRGNLVGAQNYSDYLSFFDAKRSLFFASLILSI